MRKSVYVPLIITLLISAGLGYAFSSLISFWQGFIGITVIQFIIFYITSERRIVKERKDEQNNLNQDMINLQTVPITCPCGRDVFESPIFLNFENVFKCNKCGSRFKVDLTYNSVLLTDAVNFENVFDQLKDKEQ